MSVIDIVLAALILFGLIRGFMKGLFVEIASLVALVAGVYGAINFSYFAADYLKDKTSWDEKTIAITAFAITFIIIVILIALAGKALTKIADFASLGILNKLLGGIFGALKIAFFLSVILNFFDKANKTLPFVDEATIEESILYNPVISLLPTILPNVLNRDSQEEDEVSEEIQSI